ncbi:P-loop containing nucleoside triphosphate hydrolase protein [Aspergillus bertholletiae]|uniref:P-loop containing nucleoside triphosphate hydrolase protein n=1 Tax=Aspergillus bertholletiae TaxID=1226010 RepID=A0A5N7B522_9EURO|nr:P-loop containing nucleoside triphosphate hydrolase protein [Aspergillus bertholletiae]
MGQTVSVPKPGAQIQVIGAGMPRTGTTSFSVALAILLDKPVYHCGTQLNRGPPSELKSWVRILRAWLAGDRRTVLSTLRSCLTGYAAVTDAPSCNLVPELLELYPDAKVVCTVRDPVAWEKSMEHVHGAAAAWFLKALLFPLPGMRHFVGFTWLLRRLWSRLYLDDRSLSSVNEVAATLPRREVYARHLAWLQENVPANRLVFFDVREGWEPLCKALGKDVPKDVPFPHENDSAGIERTARYHIRRALISWAAILAVVGIVLVGFARRS